MSCVDGEVRVEAVDGGSEVREEEEDELEDETPE